MRTHERLEPVLGQLALRRVEQVLELVDQPLEGLARGHRVGLGFFLAFDLGLFLIPGGAEFDGLVARALEERATERVWQVGERLVHRRAVVRGQRAQHRLVVHAHPLAHAAMPRRDGSLGQGLLRVGHHQLRVEHLEHAQPVADRARAEMAVEGKMLGRQRRQRETRLRVTVIGGVRLFRVVLAAAGRVQDNELALAPAQGRFDRIRQPRADPLAQHEPVHHGVDGMFLRLGGPDGLGAVEFDDLAVQPHAHEALAPGFLQHVAELTDLPPDQRREQDQPRAGLQGEDLVHDGLRGLAAQRPARGGVVRLADRRVQEAQVVVNLGRRGDGRARVARAGALFERDGGRQALDEIHVGFFELVEELARVGRQAFHVPPAAFRVEGVEGQRTLARTARPGDDHELAAGERQTEILQIVLARPADSDSLLGHRILPLGTGTAHSPGCPAKHTATAKANEFVLHARGFHGSGRFPAARRR